MLDEMFRLRTVLRYLSPVLALVLLGCEAELPAHIEVTSSLGDEQPYSLLDEPEHAALRLAFADGDKNLLVHRRNGSVERFDLATGKGESMAQGVSCAAFVPGDGDVLIGRGKATYHLGPTGRTIATINTKCVELAAIAPGGSFAIGQRKGFIMWSDAGGTTRTLEGTMPLRNSLALSADGEYLVAGVGEYYERGGHVAHLNIWQRNSRQKQVLDAAGMVFGMWAVEISKNNRLALPTQKTGQSGFQVIDLTNSKVVMERDGFESHWTRAIAISTDGALIVTADEKGLVRVWDVAKDELLAKLKLELPVQSAAFSNDKGQLALGYWDGTIKVASLKMVAASP